MVSSLFPFPAGGEDHRHFCNKRKMHKQQLILSFLFYPDLLSGLVCCSFLLLQAADLAAEEGDDVCGGGAGGRRLTNLGLWVLLCSV
jgi:hypothetical protein